MFNIGTIWPSKQQTLEAARGETLLDIRTERSLFDEMVRRARCNESPLLPCVDDIPQRLADLEGQVARATTKDDLEFLSDEAETLGHSRAYICPLHEIADEGTLSLDIMSEWGVPHGILEKLRQSLGAKVKSADVPEARSALRAIYEERDSWSSYVDDYNG